MLKSVLHALSAGVFVIAAAYQCLGEEEASPPPTRAPAAAAAPVAAPVKAAPADEEFPPMPEPEEVAQRVKDWHQFSAYSTDVVTRAAEGELALREARDLIIYYCLAHYPLHLEHLQMIGKGRSIKYNTAAYLVRCINDYLEIHDLAPLLSPAVLASLGEDEHELATAGETTLPPAVVLH